jgi:CHAT domain-containing protein
MALGQYDRALAALQDPKAEYHGIASLFIDKTYQKLPAAFLMAKCQFETGRLDQARDTYDRLLQHPRLPEVGGLYWQALLDRARIARKDRQDPLAEDLLRKAVDVVERQRASIGTEAGRIGFVGDKQACYQELGALLADQGRAADAFAFVERAKGRALVDLLASQKQLARGGGEAQALARLDQADQDLQALHDPAAPGARGIAVSARVQLAGVAPELASLVSVPQVDPGALQARLGADETLLEYFAAGSRWLAFVVTRDRVTATPLPVQDLTAQVLALRLALADPSRPVPDQAAALYRQLVEPVADQLRTPRLTLVPHGVLHYLPFCALGPADAPMVERFSLRVLPSATVLAFLKPGRPAGGSLILGNPDLGDPALDLPFAQEEAAALAGILPSPTLLVRKEATPDPVRAAGGRYSVIHLAAHGFFDVDHPLESALFLAPTAQGRGTLKVADLYHMDLDTDLVTLSACETALGKVSSGDDVVGFTRGLLYAGSRSVLSSLWKVDDRSTRDLMVGFYSRLGSADKAEALRQAQLEVRARMPHPYYWAAFTLTGNAR